MQFNILCKQSSIDGDKKRSDADKKKSGQQVNKRETHSQSLKKSLKFEYIDRDFIQSKQQEKDHLPVIQTLLSDDETLQQIQAQRYKDRKQSRDISSYINQLKQLADQESQSLFDQHQIHRLLSSPERSNNQQENCSEEAKIELIIEEEAGFNQQFIPIIESRIDKEDESPEKIPDKSDFRNKPKNKSGGKEGREKSVTIYMKLQQDNQNATCNALLEKEELFLEQQINDLKHQLILKQDENQDIKFNLSLQTNNNPTFQGKKARESITEQLYSRSSTITYQNYDSETKKSYYKLLISKLPNLKIEKQNLKEKIKQQNQQLDHLSEVKQKIQVLFEELKQIRNKKDQIRQYSEMFIKQIKEITDKTTYMSLEIMQIETQEKIEHHLEQLQIKYSREQKPFILDTSLLEGLLQHLEMHQYKSRVSEHYQNHRSSLNISQILNKSTQIQNYGTEILPNELGVSQKLSSSSHNEFVLEEFQLLLKPKQDILITNYQQKVKQLEQQDKTQKKQQDTRISQLQEEIEKNRKIIDMSLQVDDTLNESQAKRLELIEKIRIASAIEAPLNVELQIQLNNIRFVEEQINQLSKKYK